MVQSNSYKTSKWQTPPYKHAYIPGSSHERQHWGTEPWPLQLLSATSGTFWYSCIQLQVRDREVEQLLQWRSWELPFLFSPSAHTVDNQNGSNYHCIIGCFSWRLVATCSWFGSGDKATSGHIYSSVVGWSVRKSPVRSMSHKQCVTRSVAWRCVCSYLSCSHGCAWVTNCIGCTVIFDNT